MTQDLLSREHDNLDGSVMSAKSSKESVKKDISVINLLLLVNLGMIVYTTLQSFTKDMLTYRGVNPFEFIAFRSVFNLVSSAFIARSYNKGFFDVPKTEVSTLVFRCVVGTISFTAFTSAVKYLPLSIFFIIFNSSPFSTAIIGYVWLGESTSACEIAAIVCAFSGIIILTLSQPAEDLDEQDLNQG